MSVYFIVYVFLLRKSTLKMNQLHLIALRIPTVSKSPYLFYCNKPQKKFLDQFEFSRNSKETEVTKSQLICIKVMTHCLRFSSQNKILTDPAG